MKRWRGGGKTKVGKPADQHHPGPDIDEDSEFVAAHPAREQHLRAVSEHGADDANEESRAGDALCDRAVALIGEPRARSAQQFRRRNFDVIGSESRNRSESQNLPASRGDLATKR
jgi:hypothetical protein